MLGGLTEAEQSGAFQVLQSMIRSLHEGNEPGGPTGSSTSNGPVR
jgi:hypothetical protein